MNKDEHLFFYDNPLNHLKSEHLRLNVKNHRINSEDFDRYFERFKSLYGNHGKDFYEKDKILFKRINKEKAKLEVPLEEQDRSTFWLLKRHIDNINKILKENNVGYSKELTFGTIPKCDLNAYECSFDNEKKLIVLNQGVFKFLYLIARVITPFFIKEYNSNTHKLTFTFDANKMNEKEKLFQKYDNEFLKIIVNYYMKKNLSKSKLYFEKDNNINLSAILWDNAELFIVAHEYGHIIYNETLEYEGEMDTEDELNLSKFGNELIVDKFALQIILAYKNDMDLSGIINYLGVEFLFASLILMEEIEHTIDEINFNDIYPSTGIRIENLRNCLKHICPEYYGEIIGASKPISYILKKLWSHSKNNFYSLYYNR